jgi:hypothetical protein
MNSNEQRHLSIAIPPIRPGAGSTVSDGRPLSRSKPQIDTTPPSGAQRLSPRDPLVRLVHLFHFYRPFPGRPVHVYVASLVSRRGDFFWASELRLTHMPGLPSSTEALDRYQCRDSLTRLPRIGAAHEPPGTARTGTDASPGCSFALRAWVSPLSVLAQRAGRQRFELRGVGDAAGAVMTARCRGSA